MSDSEGYVIDTESARSHGIGDYWRISDFKVGHVWDVTSRG